MIDLYTWGTPNGRKVSIMLEAVTEDYQVYPVNIMAEEQFSNDFLTISPNNKIPAIIDHNPVSGEPLSLFESGAILVYLAEKHDLFLPTNVKSRMEVMQWLMWQMGGFGPFLGQAHHFNRFAKEDVPYAKQRYNIEAQRLWRVLDKQLADHEFVAGDLSIADFAIYPWAMRHEWQLIDFNDYPNVLRWANQLDTVEAVKKGMRVPSS